MGIALNRIWHCGGALLAVALLIPLRGFSQQPVTNVTQDPGAASTDEQNPATANPFNQQQPNAAGTGGFLVQALDSASPLAEENGPLHWGWVSIRSASFQQYFSHEDFTNPGGLPQSEDINASILTTAIVVAHTFGSSTNFALQYSPSLAISGGSIYPNALNQTMGLDTTFQLNARWGMHITDRLSYYGSQRTFTGLPFNTNFATGISVSQNYLSGPGSVLYNSFGASFSYAWTPRTTVSFAPFLGYTYATGSQSSGQTVSSLAEGGVVTLSYLLSPTQTVGISYSGQYANYANTSQSAGPQSNAFLQDFLLTYSQQLKDSWSIHLGLGITSNTGSESGTGLAANVGISKSFQHSALAFMWSRGHQFNGYVTNSASDNVGLTHSISWTPRFSTATGGFYTKTPGAYPSQQSSWYVTEQLNYGLTRQLSLFGSVAYVSQVGDSVYVLSSNRRFVSVGIMWSVPQSTRQ